MKTKIKLSAILMLLSALAFSACGGGGSGGGGGGNTPAGNPGKIITSMSAGDDFSVVTTADGSRWTWGYNWDYQLGVGTDNPQQQSRPLRRYPSTDHALYPFNPEDIGGQEWVSVSAGFNFVLGIRYDSSTGEKYLWGYGDNYWGQIPKYSMELPIKEPQITDRTYEYLSASCGYNHSIFLRNDGTIWTSGDDLYGQRGLGLTQSFGYFTSQVLLNDDPYSIDNTSWSFVCAGWYHTLAIKHDGTLWAWGLNAHGELGLGDTLNRDYPVQVDVPGKAISFVAAGQYHTVAIATDGTLWHWGYDTIYEYILTPERIGPEDDRWIKAAAGGWHTLAIRSDNSLWAWGGNNYGQLGVGEDVENDDDGTYLLLQVMPETGWLDIACGTNHSLGKRHSSTTNESELYTWGRNQHYALGTGIGDYEDRWTPQKIDLDSTVVLEPPE